MRRTPRRRRLTGPIHGRIRSLRELRGLSQEELGEALRKVDEDLGVDKTAVSHWETGVSRPEFSRIPALAKVLRVSVRELIRGEKAWEAFAEVLEAA